MFNLTDLLHQYADVINHVLYADLLVFSQSTKILTHR